MTERTLILVKPDGVRRGLIGDVLARIEGKGLRILAMDLRTLDRDTAEAHYAEHALKPFFGQLVDFITSGPLVALVAEGPRGDRGVPRTSRLHRPGSCFDGHHPRRSRAGST